MENNVNENVQSEQIKWTQLLTVKNIIIVVCGLVIIYSLIRLWGGFTGVSGENIKYYTKSDNAVYVYSVCPECDHVGDKWEAKISEGEDCRGMEICESCGHMFEIYVKRD